MQTCVRAPGSRGTDHKLIATLTLPRLDELNLDCRDNLETSD